MTENSVASLCYTFFAGKVMDTANTLICALASIGIVFGIIGIYLAIDTLKMSLGNRRDNGDKQLNSRDCEDNGR